MSNPATNWARSLPIRGWPKAILMCLADCLNERTKRCDPSVSMIAAWTGCNRQTVHAGTRKLHQMGVVTATHRKRKTTFYTLNFEWRPQAESERAARPINRIEEAENMDSKPRSKESEKPDSKECIRGVRLLARRSPGSCSKESEDPTTNQKQPEGTRRSDTPELARTASSPGGRPREAGDGSNSILPIAAREESTDERVFRIGRSKGIVKALPGRPNAMLQRLARRLAEKSRKSESSMRASITGWQTRLSAEGISKQEAYRRIEDSLFLRQHKRLRDWESAIERDVKRMIAQHAKTGSDQ